LLSYRIEIQHADGNSYSEAVNDCDGSSTEVMEAKECRIQILTTLLAEPFSLPWGSSVYARVVATNIVGDSPFSVVGNGAIMLTIPDAPIDLADDVLQTNKV
jgi:hypothetical protein